MRTGSFYLKNFKEAFVWFAVSLMFLIPMCWTVLSGCIQVATFVPAEGRINEIQGPDSFAKEEARQGGWIEYTYEVAGVPYQGTCPPEYSFGMPRQPFPQHTMALTAGDPVRVFYDPENPRESTLEPRVEATAFMFITFTLPFLLLGWLIFTRPEALQIQDAGNGMMLAGGKISFVAYALLSAVGSFAFGFYAMQTPDWKSATLLGALLPVVIIPGIVTGLQKWVDRGQGEATGRKLPSIDSEAIHSEKAGIRKQLVVWICVSLFWCGITGIFASGILTYWVGVVQGKNYVQTEAMVIRSEIQVSQRGTNTSYTVQVEYEYEVGDVAYVSDRIDFGWMKMGQSRKRANDLKKVFQTGARVPVFYDPADPQRAVLIREVSLMRILLTVFITPFVLIGGYMIWKTVSLLKRCFLDF
ncbi:DUF3592 domain-containing protein [Kiritimatiellaeota bacterium B1221]|nr:DUF3592 domain-containing protein [Kiritimatiellaeota bacterium B1221]